MQACPRAVWYRHHTVPACSVSVAVVACSFQKKEIVHSLRIMVLMRRCARLRLVRSGSYRAACHWSSANDVLRLAAAQQGFTSDLWFSQRDFNGQLDLGTAARRGRPVRLETRRERAFINKDDLGGAPPHAEPATHGSLVCDRPFPPSARDKLQRHADAHGLRSTLWVTATAARSRGWRIRTGAVPFVERYRRSALLYNASQFDEDVVRDSVWTLRAGARIVDPLLHCALRTHMQ